MRILMHTMATPDLDPIAALDLARALHLGGIELVCQAGYRCALAPDARPEEARALGEAARERGLRIAALVPYERRINAANDRVRGAAIEDLRHAIRLAAISGAKSMRILAGEEVPDEHWGGALVRIADSLRTLAVHAEQFGVTLNIENHMDTMATSAERTMRIWRATGHLNVGVIYDPANLIFMGAEDFPRSYTLQKRAIRHVHVKDFTWRACKRQAVLPGQGLVPWPAIIGELAAGGFEGYFSLEYEKRWFPDQLPDPEIGLAAARDFLLGLSR